MFDGPQRAIRCAMGIRDACRRSASRCAPGCPPGPLEHVERVSTTSVAIELDQPLVADPEVMRDLVEHDVPDLAT